MYDYENRKLIGDDFNQAQIDEWFADEVDGYANLGAKDLDKYIYPYHKLNSILGFNRIKLNSGSKVLAFGAAYGDEVAPILTNISELTLIDTSSHFESNNEFVSKTIRIKPNSSGEISLPDHQFDLITCFGVLHHIPNVSFVFSELYRCLKPGGYLLLREPIVSMGDSSRPRKGLTKRERGLPYSYLMDLFSKYEFSHLTFNFWSFSLLSRISRFFANFKPFNSTVFVYMDIIASYLMSFNKSYHRGGFFSRIGPTAIFVVIKK